MKLKASLILASLTLVTLVLPALADVPLGPPRPSPMSTVSQVVGAVEVSVTYSRPAVKERSIWGGLVPLDKMWRTGANEATTLTLGADATVGGQKVPAGTYALFTIPTKDSWTVVLNEDSGQWGAFQHDEAKDVARFQVKPQSADHSERFDISFPAVSDESVDVRLHWEKVAVTFPIEFDATEQILAKARKEVANGPGNDQFAWGWANYCNNNDINLEQALEWINAVVEAREIYWTRSLQARLLAKNGRHADAIEAANRAMELGEETKAENPRVAGDMETLTAEVAEWKGADA